MDALQLVEQGGVGTAAQNRFLVNQRKDVHWLLGDHIQNAKNRVQLKDSEFSRCPTLEAVDEFRRAFGPSGGLIRNR